MIISEAVRGALEAGHLAHLTTLDPDGGPQVTLVWIGMDGDEVVCAHLAEHRKVRNVRRDPRVVVSMLTGGKNPFGLDNYLVVGGRARVTEGGAPELLQRLAAIYIGPDVKFPPMQDPPPGYVTHITIDRIGGVGPWSQPAS